VLNTSTAFFVLLHVSGNCVRENVFLYFSVIPEYKIMPHRLNNVPSFAEIYPLRTVIDRATREYASREIGVNGRTTV